MNSNEKFIPIEQAIWQIERNIGNKILLGNILQNQGFLDLELYTENDNGDKILMKDIEKSAIYKLIRDEYPVTKFSELKSTYKIHRANRFDNYGIVGSINRAQKILSMMPPKQSLPYYWRTDDFYKKLGNSKSLGETVVYYANQMTSDEQKKLADKKLQSELEKTKASLVEQKHQLQAKSDEANNLKVQLDQANERITELEKIIEQSKTATTPIFDSQDGYTYPLELDMAIKIWIEIYQTDNIPKHLTNHSDKFTQACKNLGFSFTENAVKTRLKKVTTPQSQKEKTKNKNSLK